MVLFTSNVPKVGLVAKTASTQAAGIAEIGTAQGGQSTAGGESVCGDAFLVDTTTASRVDPRAASASLRGRFTGQFEGKARRKTAKNAVFQESLFP